MLLDAEEKEPAAKTQENVGMHSTPEKLDIAVLPNAFQINQRIISGGLPEGDEAFSTLADLGVKTVISVDGMAPDVATAKKYGLNYIHLPHGYDGVPSSRILELSKAVLEANGVVYIHCHHGKHRSPAAAAAVCITNGWMNTDEGIALLTMAGTSPNYRGLYSSVEKSTRVADAVLNSLRVQFLEQVPLPPMAKAMVQLDHEFELLGLLAKNSWQQSAKHPDLNAAHQALLVREHYTELLRTDDVAARSDEFKAQLRQAETFAANLEKLLSDFSDADHDEVDAAFSQVGQNCKDCHQRFRDVPQE